MSVKHSIVSSLLTPSKLLIAIFGNPKQRFQVSFPVYRVSGTNRKQYVMPDLGIRAVQGHSTRGDVGLEYLIAAQDKLRAEQSYLAFLSVSMAQIAHHGQVLCRPNPSFLVALQAAELQFTLL